VTFLTVSSLLMLFFAFTGCIYTLAGRMESIWVGDIWGLGLPSMPLTMEFSTSRCIALQR
jgi:hypothetical protein